MHLSELCAVQAGHGTSLWCMDLACVRYDRVVSRTVSCMDPIEPTPRSSEAGVSPVYVVPAVPVLNRALIVLLVVASALLIGCAPKTVPSALHFASAEYPIVFQAAKDVLRDAEFELDVVDARRGVLTTQPRLAAGFATPWIPHTKGLSASIGVFLQHEMRQARVTFVPESGQIPADVRVFEGTLVANIEVTTRRIHRPGRRVSPISIRIASFSRDTTPGATHNRDNFTYTERDDPKLARRLSNTLIRRVERDHK